MSDPPPGLRRGERRRWGAFIWAVLLIAYLAWSLIMQLQQGADQRRQEAAKRSTDQCVATWATLTSQRSAIISRYNLQKETAATELAGIAASDPRHTAALETYRLAQKALSSELALYPPPKYNCAEPQPRPKLRPTAVPSTVTATQSATATHIATRTATATRTTTIVAPGRTTVETQRVPMPGRTVTVTRTVSPPSCLTHPIPPCTLDILEGP